MNVVSSLRRFINFSLRFGFRTAWGYIAMPYLKKREGFESKHQAVKNYLYRWSRGIMDVSDCNSSAQTSASSVRSPIWVCWLQGESNMPEVIRLCYNSVKRNAGGREVILLSADNLGNYVEIPDSVNQKLRAGQLSLTHYADYLRILLLKTHGGLWIDASIYVVNQIDFNVEEDELYTVKFHSDSNTFVSKCRWTVSLIGTQPGNILFDYLEWLMRKYIELHDQFIDFFLFDYFIAMLYDRNERIKAMIDNVRNNNSNFYELERLANHAFKAEMFQRIFKDQIYCKLSWKSQYVAEKDGNKTFYGKLSEQ